MRTVTMPVGMKNGRLLEIMRTVSMPVGVKNGRRLEIMRTVTVPVGMKSGRTLEIMRTVNVTVPGAVGSPGMRQAVAIDIIGSRRTTARRVLLLGAEEIRSGLKLVLRPP